MNITLKFGGDHPLDIVADALSGYHRPLDGEVANLTATCPQTAFFPEWLSSPPLGLDCAVEVDGEDIMAGILYGARVTTEDVELRIEG